MTRNFDLEKKLYNKYNVLFAKYHWKPLIIKNLFKNQIYRGPNWHQIEVLDSVKYQWSSFNSDLYFETDCSDFSIGLEFYLPDNNFYQNQYIQYSLFKLVFNERNYSFSYVLVDSGTKDFAPKYKELIRQKIQFKNLMLSKYKLIINSPTWNPTRLNISNDNRELGYFFKL